jgi:hypothetical protein
MDNILLISYSCSPKSCEEPNEVRSCLHKCIERWIHLQIVPRQFMFDLEREERRWSFKRPHPRFPVQQQEAPRAFDLAMAGVIGWCINASYLKPESMKALVQSSMEQGVQDGWLYKDKNGHHKIHHRKGTVELDLVCKKSGTNRTLWNQCRK